MEEGQKEVFSKLPQNSSTQQKQKTNKAPLWIFVALFCLVLAGALTIILWPKNNTPTPSGSGSQATQADLDDTKKANNGYKAYAADLANNLPTDERLSVTESKILPFEKAINDAEDNTQKVYLALEFAEYYYKNIEQNLEHAISIVVQQQHLIENNLVLADFYHTLSRLYAAAGDTSRATESEENAKQLESSGLWKLNGEPAEETNGAE